LYPVDDFVDGFENWQIVSNQVAGSIMKSLDFEDLLGDFNSINHHQIDSKALAYSTTSIEVTVPNFCNSMNKFRKKNNKTSSFVLLEINT